MTNKENLLKKYPLRKTSINHLEPHMPSEEINAAVQPTEDTDDKIRKSLVKRNVSATPVNTFSATQKNRQGGNQADRGKAQTALPSINSQNHQLTESTSKTINNTIQQLERLLDEAVKVAQVAAEIQDEAARTQSSSETIRTKEEVSPEVKSFVKADKLILRNAALESTPGHELTFPFHQQIFVPNGGSQLSSRSQKACDLARNKQRGVLYLPASVALTMPESTLKNPRNADQSKSISPSPRHRLTPASRSRASSVVTERPTAMRTEPAINARTSSLCKAKSMNPDVTKSIRVPTLQLNGEVLENAQETDKIHPVARMGHSSHFSHMFGVNSRHESMRLAHPEYSRCFDLKNHDQIDFALDIDDEDFHKSCNHAPVARNWPVQKKRLTAIITCTNTACIGLILGIYAGEVPAIQYVIIDLDHSIILGNVVLYLGLMFSTLFLWPLPVLHGRKPYTVAGIMLALCLQVPQGIAVISIRLPNQVAFKVMLLLARGLSGLALGLCDINLTATLLDLFGASLQSRNPYQELSDPNDVRRHGGGIGLWLGIWSWCSIGPLSIGFMIGAFIVSHATVDWGFWTAQLLLMMVLLLNIASPEVRRSAFRRTLVELMSPQGEFARVARGEVKMHLRSEGPSWWGEEVVAGFQLVRMMLNQFGFLILSVYTAWVYAQYVLVLMLIGSLASSVYFLKPIQVGLCAVSVAVGSILAIPFQKASWLSRARSYRPRTDSMTLQRSVVWSSHLVRRTVFTIALPIFAVMFTLTSNGPPSSIAIPCVMASFVGFFSNMATAECYSLVFEAFDTSDLQPGMTGRPARRSIVRRYADQRTNFSSNPRIMAGISVIQAIKFGFAAAATGLTGRVTRSMGARHSTAVVAGILLGLTFLMTAVTIRWNTVQMIPDPIVRRDGSIWEPTVLGRPSGTTRKISIFEAGKLTRWSEIRRRNRLESMLTNG